MKRFRKIYVEISNICNLQCSFCPGTKRKPYVMTAEEFKVIIQKVQPYTDFVYFHIMGEPLLHPNLKSFLDIAGQYGLKTILTTNGTLLPEVSETLLTASGLHKVNISLHSFEANAAKVSFNQYLSDCFSFGKKAEGKILTVYRLWNHGGADSRNKEILESMHTWFPGQWNQSPKGTAIGDHVFLEYGDKFDWPDLSAPCDNTRSYCYGMRDQIGVLCDGTVVPCCLDHEGDIPLGNIFEKSIEEILSGERAKAIFDGFQKGQITEQLCRHCGYATRFS